MATLQFVDTMLAFDEVRLGRLRDAVERLHVLDTPPEQAFDDIVMLATEVCRVPIALVGFMAGERYWFKSQLGMGTDHIESCGSMCEVTVLLDELVIVEDAARDPRFVGRSFVSGPPHLRFYCGIPIHDPDHTVVGALALADVQPRTITSSQKTMLEALGRQVEQLLALRVSMVQLETERDQARARERHFRSVLQSLANGVMVYDANGVIEDVNPAGEAILNMSRDMLVGAEPLHSPAYHEDGTAYRQEDRPVAITLKYGIDVRDVVMGVPRGDNVRRWLLVNSSPLWDRHERGTGAVVTFADVTDLLTLNNQLQESLGELARAAQERAAMLSSVSHDIRAPLAAIRMMTEILEDRADAITDTQRSELIHRVRAEARRTEGVLTDLVSANRVGTGLEAPRRKRIDLEQLIYARAREFDGGTHSVRVGTLHGDLTMWADGAQVERILDNLVSNALTHTPAGSKIVIEADEQDGRIELAVDDDGPGVPDDMRVRVFSAYVRGERSADRPGTGLGLFLVQQFAQFHGGTARCLESTRGGARFVVTLPRRPGQLSAGVR